MPPVKTRECTEVFTHLPPPHTLHTFTERPVERVNHFLQGVFTSDDRIEEGVILASLIQRLEEEVARKRESKKTVKKPTPLKESRKEKVNKKREFIKRVLEHQAHLNLREVARFTKSCWNTVKSVRNELLTHGVLTPYEYNNLKTPQQLSLLHEKIEEAEDRGTGVSDIKRLLPSFSKKFILQEFHTMGFKYCPLPRQRKNPTNEPPNSTRVRRVISHLCQGLVNNTAEVLYCDEMKFPLCQTSTHTWTSHPPEERPVYNRRSDERQLTAIAMCSTKGFVAVQIFFREVTGVDFLYFMNKAMASLPPGKSYTCLLDNASWHKSHHLVSSEVNKFFFFNEPRMFQLNLIENAFSFVRNSFRKRPLVVSPEEEAREIVKIFFAAENERRFRGVKRNHLRQLIKYFEKHSL